MIESRMFELTKEEKEELSRLIIKCASENGATHEQVSNLKLIWADYPTQH